MASESAWATTVELATESDVEQKFIARLLVEQPPFGLGYLENDFLTKIDIRKLAIDKGKGKKLYYPDYAVICDGLPLVIIEAKTPGEDLDEALREARLYASEINSSYQRNVNPCERVIATDGINLIASFWDQADPLIRIKRDQFHPASVEFANFLEFASKASIKRRAAELLRTVRTTARYFKPVHMLGGKSIANETVGDNSFGTNVSIEYKYLFNPESVADREAVIHNAYVSSKKKQAHVAPIDKLIRTALPRQLVDAKLIDDSGDASPIFESVQTFGRARSEICLLIGSVGSGKSTFTDYLKLEALPSALAHSTEWVNINLNKAPLSRDLIYQWVVNEVIEAIAQNYPALDFSALETIKKIYSRELSLLEKGRASLFSKDSDRYREIIFDEISMLQKDIVATLAGIINLVHKGTNKLLVIVLDNCDKRNRDDQLLMFEVASWLKSSFACMVFLPLRDTTYDQYRNEPPLDTVIKDLVFRIDPPLLEKVIYARLNYALREIDNQSAKFTFHLSNSMKVECARSEVGVYLKAIIASLFQDQLFRRIITGLAGRNIRKGLEILLDFCKSGHIGADEILKIRTSVGEYKIPNHVIAKILLKGKRKYYGDIESNIKNLFSSDDGDDLPDPFVRIAILQWLKNRWREIGPNRIVGFHQTSQLIGDLQKAGHAEQRIMKELGALVSAGCIFSETQTNVLDYRDLISIAPSGQIHLDLLRNVNYLSAISEDVLFRENQVAKQIADNIVGRGKYRSDSRQTVISNGMLLINYLAGYQEKFLLGQAKVLANAKAADAFDIGELKELLDNLFVNDGVLRNANIMELEHPLGSEIEGQIVSMQDYGFFVEFGLHGSGLVHKSNFTQANLEVVDLLEVGDWILVKVLRYAADKGRFDLELLGLTAETQFQIENHIGTQ